MIYTHRFRVNAPLDDVIEFHRRSSSMAAITPPPVVVQMHTAPEWLTDGDEMDFTMWLGPLPIRWVARIQATDGPGFLDQQMQGPFHQWVHRHVFVPVGEEATEVYDEVFLLLHETNWLWKLIGFSMWMGLPLLFAYRSWRTRHLLEEQG